MSDTGAYNMPYRLGPDDFYMQKSDVDFQRLVKLEASEQTRCVFRHLYGYYSIFGGHLLPTSLISKLFARGPPVEADRLGGWIQFAIDESLDIDFNMNPSEWLVLASNIGTHKLTTQLEICFNKQIISPDRYIEALEICGSIFILENDAESGILHWTRTIELRKAFKIPVLPWTSSVNSFEEMTIFETTDDLDALRLLPALQMEKAVLMLERNLGSRVWPPEVNTNFMIYLLENFEENYKACFPFEETKMFLPVATLLLKFGADRSEYTAYCIGSDGPLLFIQRRIQDSRLIKRKHVKDTLDLKAVCGYLRVLFCSAKPCSPYDASRDFFLQFIGANLNLEELNRTILSPTDGANLLHLAVVYWFFHERKLNHRTTCESIIELLLRRGVFSGYPSWYCGKTSYDIVCKYFCSEDESLPKMNKGTEIMLESILSNICDCFTRKTVRKYKKFAKQNEACCFAPPSLRCLAAFVVTEYPEELRDTVISVTRDVSASLSGFVGAHRSQTMAARDALARCYSP